jgi:hypothetical protein
MTKRTSFPSGPFVDARRTVACRRSAENVVLPIYTGLILAMLGSAIGVNIFWAVLLVPVGVYFILSARREETITLQIFPEQYAAYMAQTGMLAPRLFRRC